MLLNSVSATLNVMINVFLKYISRCIFKTSSRILTNQQGRFFDIGTNGVGLDCLVLIFMM